MNLELVFPFTMSILGACNSGKSHFIKYLIKRYKKKIDVVVVFTTTGFNGNYKYLSEYGIKNYLIDPLNLAKDLLKIMNKQKKYLLQGLKPNVVLVFDDVMGSINPYDKKLQMIISSFRHYETSLVYVSQYASCIPTYIRELSYYSIIFNQTTIKSLKSVYENYFPEAGNFNQFKNEFQRSLQQYQFYFVDKVKKKTIKAKAPAVL